MSWLHALPRKKQRGSYLRCLHLTHGEPAVVAARLTALVGLPGVRVEPHHRWMPRGLPLKVAGGGWNLTPTHEAVLGRADGFLSAKHRAALTDWWLAVPKNANTPNWDIATTATVDGREGLILVEAKAHDKELKEEGKGEPTSANSCVNHARIGEAIEQANGALNQIQPGFGLSRDHHYQLANRFAWAWKVASLGVPVVLVYLGYLQAEEMSDKGQPFADEGAWIDAIMSHAKGIVPPAIWGQPLRIGDGTLTAVIRATRVDLQGTKAPCFTATPPKKVSRA